MKNVFCEVKCQSDKIKKYNNYIFIKKWKSILIRKIMKDLKKMIEMGVNIKTEFHVGIVTVTMIAILKDQNQGINIRKVQVRNIKNLDAEIPLNRVNLIKNLRNTKAEEG